MADADGAETADGFPIEELSRRTGMTVRTLRAYQSKRVMPPPEVRARIGYYTERHVARVELVKELQAEGFKLETIARMLDQSGQGDRDVLRFSRTVRSLFGEEPAQIVTIDELAARFQVESGAGALLSRAEKLGLIRRVDEQRFEEVAPRLLETGVLLQEYGVDAHQALKLLERLRKQADGVAKLYLDTFMTNVWKPFVAAGQPDEDWPRVERALQGLRPIAQEALSAVFDLVMSDRVDELLSRELPRAVQARQTKSSKEKDR